MFGKLFMERRRSKAIRKLNILDMPAPAPFQRYVEQAATAFDAPIGLLSLIYDDEMRFKACHGLALDSLPRRMGFCSHALDRPNLLEICDPQGDPRFNTLPVVTGDPFVRYYIGAPLRLLGGIDVGALCVIDTRVRPPASADQRAYMVGLARLAAMTLQAEGTPVGELAA